MSVAQVVQIARVRKRWCRYQHLHCTYTGHNYHNNQAHANIMIYCTLDTRHRHKHSHHHNNDHNQNHTQQPKPNKRHTTDPREFSFRCCYVPGHIHIILVKVRKVLALIQSLTTGRSMFSSDFTQSWPSGLLAPRSRSAC